MLYPPYMVAFGLFFYGGLQAPHRLFPKLDPKRNPGVTHEYYTSHSDLVSKFRLFEDTSVYDAQENYQQYLAATLPVTKNELLDYVFLKASQEIDITKLFQIKRSGKDRDPLFWSFGKIHGLENIAFADPEEVKATNGNPVSL